MKCTLYCKYALSGAQLVSNKMFVNNVALPKRFHGCLMNQQDLLLGTGGRVSSELIVS